MKRILFSLVAFAVRHWLRIGLLTLAVILLSRQQLSFHVQLGGPDRSDAATELTRMGAEGGLFSLLNFFGKTEERAPGPDRVSALTDRPVGAFLTRFAHVARAEQQKFGIPASIILAVSLLESQAGTALATESGNSYFGLPATADWEGAVLLHQGRELRRYETAWMSFRDFSLYLRAHSPARLRSAGPRNYREWAASLEEAQGLGRPGLASELIATIDRYQLFQYD